MVMEGLGVRLAAATLTLVHGFYLLYQGEVHVGTLQHLGSVLPGGLCAQIVAQLLLQVVVLVRSGRVESRRLLVLTLLSVAFISGSGESQAEFLVLLIPSCLHDGVSLGLRLCIKLLRFLSFLLVVLVNPVQLLICELLRHPVRFFSCPGQFYQVHEVLTLDYITVVEDLGFKVFHGVADALLGIELRCWLVCSHETLAILA